MVSERILYGNVFSWPQIKQIVEGDNKRDVFHIFSALIFILNLINYPQPYFGHRAMHTIAI